MGIGIGTTKIEKICYKVEELYRGALLLGLVWSCIVVAIWHLWRERNQMWHNQISRPMIRIAQDIIAKLKCRESKFKAAHQLRSKSECMATRVSHYTLSLQVRTHNPQIVSEEDLIHNEDHPELE